MISRSSVAGIVSHSHSAPCMGRLSVWALVFSFSCSCCFCVVVVESSSCFKETPADRSRLLTSCTDPVVLLSFCMLDTVPSAAKVIVLIFLTSTLAADWLRSKPVSSVDCSILTCLFFVSSCVCWIVCLFVCLLLRQAQDRLKKKIIIQAYFIIEF